VELITDADLLVAFSNDAVSHMAAAIRNNDGFADWHEACVYWHARGAAHYANRLARASGEPRNDR
jgi:hypothetical protein